MIISNDHRTFLRTDVLRARAFSLCHHVAKKAPEHVTARVKSPMRERLPADVRLSDVPRTTVALFH